MSSKPANQKRRNNEKRKEKSRVAARFRRTKEMQIFSELTAAIPAKKEEVEQLDKASVMRLAISFLRTREVVAMLPDVPQQSEKLPKAVPEDVSSELSYMKALDGFVLTLSQQGDIVYCSENISEHLGVSQMEIMGQSVFEISHPCDHDEIREALRANNTGRRDLLLRLKCTLTSKGRSVHLKSASYKVIHVTGHMLTSLEKEAIKTEANNNYKEENDEGSKIKALNSCALIAVGRPIPHPSNIEVPLGAKTFLTKHSLDMKFTYIDETLKNSLGFEPDELVGRPLYEYHHAADSAALVQHFKSLFSKGQCETGQYRFLAKSGGYAWVQTQATLITDKQQKPISIVCVNYIVSGIEFKDEVFAAHQLRHAEVKPNIVPAPVPICKSANAPNGAIVELIQPELERPKPATELIFAPRTKEMNKGFLTFQDEGVTMLKDEPEDLTHLAPTAGDACIPLENTPFDMFDDFILNDNYCSLLGDDLANGSPVDSLTDSLLLSSPEPLETDSSCEPSLLTEFSIETRQSEGELEDVKSPFIPHGDELPVIAPAVMWGALPDNVSLARPQRTEPQTTSPAPALQRLLAEPPTGPPPQDLISNIYSYQGVISSKDVATWDTGAKRVHRQEDEPNAKRIKRSPSPVAKSAPSSQTSSVLMNLLDGAKPEQQNVAQINPRYQHLLAVQKLSRAPTNITNRNIQTIPPQVVRKIIPMTQQPNYEATIRSNLYNSNSSNPISPLSLNIGSPMYSLPGSPNCSPAISPALREHIMSPYSRSQSPMPPMQQAKRFVSPGRILQAGDPYLSQPMQPSPNFTKSEPINDVDMVVNDIWMESDIFQESNGLLSSLDDIKLV